MNKCLFTGRLVEDVILRTTADGKKTQGRFAFAVEYGYAEYKRTFFLNMIAWNQKAVALERFAKKGTKLELECSAIQSKFTNKDGVPVSRIEFWIDDWAFAESKKAASQPAQFNPPNTTHSPTHNTDFVPIEGNTQGEDLPF